MKKYNEIKRIPTNALEIEINTKYYENTNFISKNK
jgi:hypothetical protein